MDAELHEAVAIEPHLVPVVPKVFFHEVKGKGVVAGRDGGVGGESGGPVDDLVGLFIIDAGLDHFADAFEDQKGGVTFVHVPGGGVDVEATEGTDATDAEDDLLLDAGLLVAAVEAGGELAIPGGVALGVGVHEDDAHLARVDAPEVDKDRPVIELDLDLDAVPVLVNEREDGGITKADLGVDRFLPAVGGDALAKVALGVHKADSEEGDAEVTGLFEVVAREDAEAAGIDGDRVVKAELGRKVGDRPRVEVGVCLAVPLVAVAHVGVEAHHDLVEFAAEGDIGGQLLELFGGHAAQHFDGVVAGGAPEGIVPEAKEVAGVGLPDPPEVVDELIEPRDRLGELDRVIVLAGDKHGFDNSFSGRPRRPMMTTEGLYTQTG